MFSRSHKLVTLSGFDIRIDPSWLVLVVLITWSLSAQYFPTTVADQAPMVYLSMAIAAMLGFFASLLLHELAHALIARKQEVRINSITLFLFGGVAELETEPRSASAELKIALAGPAASLALAFAFGSFGALSARLSLAGAITHVFGYLSTINLLLALFNLLPAFPLDGGRVLRALLWQQSGDILKATEIAARSGSLLAYVMMGIGLIAILNGYFVAGLWQILIGSFLLVASRSSYQQQLQASVFAGRTVADTMTPDPVTVSPDMTLSHVINRIALPRRISFLPVVEDGVLLGTIDSSILGSIDRENWQDTKVGDIFIELNPDRLLTPETSITDTLDLIARTNQRKFFVVRDRELVGVITLADLTRYMGLVRALNPNHKDG